MAIVGPVLLVAIVVASMLLWTDGQPAGDGPSLPAIHAARGGTQEQPDGFRITVPPGALAAGGEIRVRRHVPNRSRQQVPGEIVEVSAPAEVLDAPIRLELPVDLAALPAGLEPGNVYPVTLRGDRWVELPGAIDTERRVVVVDLRHLCLVSWRADAGHVAVRGSFAASYFPIGDFLFGPEPDAWEALERRRDDLDAAATSILAGAGDAAPLVSRDAESLGRIVLDGRTLEIVPTSHPAPDGSGRPLAAVRDAGGALTTDPPAIYRALFAWRARDRLLRMDRAGYAAALRKNADILRRARRWHEAGRLMDVAQKCLVDILAAGTAGTGAVSIAGHVAPLLQQIVAAIADLEAARAAARFEEAADALERFDAGEDDYRTISFAYATVMDAAERTDAVRGFLEATFPGHGESFAAYQVKRVLLAFVGAGLSSEARHRPGTLAHSSRGAFRVE